MAGLLAVPATYAASALAGVFAGLSLAGALLAIAGQPLLSLETAKVQMLLVIGPLLGVLPMALLASGAARYADVARHAPAAFGVWLAAAVLTFCWYGLRPLLG